MQQISQNDTALQQVFASAAVRAASVDAGERRKAEDLVQEYQNSVDKQAGFVPFLLQMVVSGGPSVAPFCSIVLKNTVKSCWDPSTSEHCVLDTDKAILRDNIVGVLLGSSTELTQRNLSEAVSIIAKCDFPRLWPNALSLLVQVLASADSVPAVRCAALSTAHSILANFRTVTIDEQSYESIVREVYAELMVPIMDSMELLWSLCKSPSGDAVRCCKGVTYGVECILDISSVDIGDELVLNLDRLSQMFLSILSCENAALMGASEYDVGPLVTLKSTTTSCITHFLNSFDEDFAKYASAFLKVVWDLLASPQGRMPSMDDLAVQGLELLSNACRSTTKVLFQPAAIQSLCSHVVIPNIEVSQEDLDLLEDDPVAYVQREMEGSDVHTRRRAAAELVQSLMRYLGEAATPVLLQELQRLRAEAPGNWKSKEASIFLSVALALDGNIADVQRGTTRLTQFVDLGEFMTGVVIPELTSSICDSSPAVVKAACLRTVSVFRLLLDSQTLSSLLPCLQVWIACGVEAVSSFAAFTLEKLLAMDALTEAMFAPFAPRILECLCMVVEGGDPYVALSLLRACRRFPGAVRPFAVDVAGRCDAAVGKLVERPLSPLFAHCVFEVLSRCIAVAPESGGAMEALLWVNLVNILVKDVTDYVPYSLQILAQLLRTHAGSASPPEQYHALFPPLTDSTLYKQRGNIPAAVCLLNTFVRYFPSFVHSNNSTERVLATASNLVQLKNFDHEGLGLLTTVIISYPASVVDQYLTGILNVVLKRLRAAKTPKYVRIFILFLSIVVLVRGVGSVAATLNSIQPGLFRMVLVGVWLRDMQKITGDLERKTCVIALTHVLCESEEFQAEPEEWAKGVYACLKMVHLQAEEDDVTSFSPAVRTVANFSAAVKGQGEEGYTNVFCPLSDAIEAPQDVCSEVDNCDAYFRSQLMQFLQAKGAALVPVLKEKLSPDLLALIQ